MQIAVSTHIQDFELEKQARELAFKKWDAELDAEVEEAKMTSSGVIEVKKLNKPAPAKEAA